jgi:hypothetical protein
MGVEIEKCYRNREGQWNCRVTEDVIIAGCRHCLAFYISYIVLHSIYSIEWLVLYITSII